MTKPKFVLVHSTKDTDVVLAELDVLFKIDYLVVIRTGGDIRLSENYQRQVSDRCLRAQREGWPVLIHNRDAPHDKDLNKDQLRTLTHYSYGYLDIPKELLPYVDLEMVAAPVCDTHYWHLTKARTPVENDNEGIAT